jgi:hypothetical protein
MMRRVEMEKKEFDASLFKLQGTRAVFATLSTELYSLIGMDVVQHQADAVRAAMEGARFATGMRAPVREFFEARAPAWTPPPPRSARSRHDGIDVRAASRPSTAWRWPADALVAGALPRRDRRHRSDLAEAVRHRDPADHQPRHPAGTLLRLDRLARQACLPRRRTPMSKPG